MWQMHRVSISAEALGLLPATIRARLRTPNELTANAISMKNSAGCTYGIAIP